MWLISMERGHGELMKDDSGIKRGHSSVTLVPGQHAVVGRGKFDVNSEQLRLNVGAKIVSRDHLRFSHTAAGGLSLADCRAASRGSGPSLVWLKRGCDSAFEQLPSKPGSVLAGPLQEGNVVRLAGRQGDGKPFQYDLSFLPLSPPSAAPDPTPILMRQPPAIAAASRPKPKRRRTDSFAGDETTAGLDPLAFQKALDRGAECEGSPGVREIEVRRAGEPAYWKLVVTLNIDTRGTPSSHRGPPPHYTILYLRAPNSCATGYPGAQCTKAQPRLIPEGLCSKIEAVCDEMFGPVDGVKQDLHDTVGHGTYASDDGLIVRWRRRVARICDEDGFTFASTACRDIHDVHCTAGSGLGLDENNRVRFKGMNFSKMSAPIASNLSLWWHIMYKLGDGGKAARDGIAMLQMHMLANLIAKLDVPVRLQVSGAVKLKGIGPARAGSINTALRELLAAADAGPTKTPPQDHYNPAMLVDNPWASQEDRRGLTPSQEAACAADPWAAPASAGANTATPAPTMSPSFPALLGLGQLMPWPQVAVLSLTVDAQHALKPLLDTLCKMTSAVERPDRLHMSLYRPRSGTNEEKTAAVKTFKHAVGTVKLPHGMVRPTQVILKQIGADYGDCVVLADRGTNGRGTMRALRPPRAERSLDQNSNAPYVLLLMVEEVPGGEAAAFVAACQDAVNARDPAVNDACFQRDGTRHVTLVKNIKRPTAEALQTHGFGGEDGMPLPAPFSMAP